MSVKIRLRRAGAKKKPSYRVVVADSHTKRDGSFIEIVGQFNPLTEPPSIKINDERVRNWLAKGAQPTDAVARLLEKSGVLPPKDRQALGQAKPPAEKSEA